MSKSRQITDQDMVDYYDAILRNGKDLPRSARQYVSELREAAAIDVTQGTAPQEGNTP
jgi:hypothetical protein